MRRFQAWVIVALLSAAALAQAQEKDAPKQPAHQGESVSSGGQMTSLLSGEALRSGTVLHAQLGWPGLSLGLLTSIGQALDVGGRLSIVYAYEGITRVAGIPGLKLQGVARLQLLERGKINLGLRFSPGLFVYFFPGGTEIGIPLPVDLTFGFALSPKMMINLGLDIPMFAVFGPYGGLAVPVLAGGGLEYAVDRQLALTLNLRVGPSVPLTGYGYYYAFWQGYWCFDAFGRPYQCGSYYSNIPAMEALFGVTYRL
jgi:hypothetical protein